MNSVTIKIETGNAAFDEGQHELARIFKELAEAAENGEFRERKIRDINGNVVGSVEIAE